MLEPQWPSRPSTATLVPLVDPNHATAFAFAVVFPDDRRVFVRNPPIKPTHVLDPKLCKEFTTYVVDHLLKFGDENNVRNTNWTSVQAAIQRLIVEFNNRQAQGSVIPGDRTVQ